MGKPVHPATVHFPISFLFLGFALDILNHVRTSLPSTLSNNLLSAAEMSKASYYLLSIGLISSIPAVVTGGREAVVMIAKQGMWDSDGKTTTMKPKVKATIAHALMNDVVIAVSTYVWYSRRAAANNSLAGKVGAASAYTPATWMVIAEVVVTVLMMMAANVGGVLTYNFGVGFSRMDSGKKSQ
ncbi:hypothetical protein M409DRAFT_21317 [Zasmidium cellare ATCC 36951]|uniref:DUF2231 domain-containing protein n=1 Tax=Zasmidium cellare ATCC 36951 TaxID=1080233 RepID=A0A6A6CMT3_ZASCE|nr:uncharacterized protein M409DRAFT_21317 [Zasmidium cellare ATCC 36951]KAF2168567.1 hypothetical protein M409DRAFT_21317 [Zasmidium cellare ATCC 36951]